MKKKSVMASKGEDAGRKSKQSAIGSTGEETGEGRSGR